MYGAQKRKEQLVEPPVIAGRVPPHDLDAEAAVLSAALVERDALDRVLEILEPEQFYSEANRLVYEACLALAMAGTPVDIINVNAWLRDRQQIQRVGGVAYLAQLADATPAVAHVAAHARIVKEKWRLRRLISVCHKYAAEGYGDVGLTQQFIDAAEQAVYELARTPETSTVLPLKDVLTATFQQLSAAAERGDSITGVPTGFLDLDRLTAGLHKGELMIVASRPGMGKTSLVLNIAANVALPQRVSTQGGEIRTRPGWGVAFFSLEMPKEQVAQRMVCAEARVDAEKLRKCRLAQDEWTALTTSAAKLATLPIWIDDKPALSILELRAKVRRLQAELGRGAAAADAAAQRGETGRAAPQGLGLVAVDYLQLMRASGRHDNREQEISEISRGLKQLAKELDVPVIALSQLNRGVETRGEKDKRPKLSDLRESGALEQDADTIVFIYRDDYYHPESPERGEAELIVAKQRNGPTDRVRVRWAKSFTLFENLAPGEYDGGGGGYDG